MELGNLDRLSNLPDEILHRIISFMKVRHTVQTCILSKRWKNLWRQLPYLNFNHVDFRNSCQFDRFVDSFLKHRGTSGIKTFHLDWKSFNVGETTKSWINYVFTSEHLGYYPVELPHSFFPSSSIEEIYLRGSYFPMKEIRHESIDLVKLKCLHLSRVCWIDEFMQNLITGCPRLEEMTMEDCTLETSIIIASRVLKKLDIEDCSCSTDVKIHLSIPSLCSLHVSAIPGKVLWENMPSLVTAHLNLWYSVPDCYRNSGYKLLSSLSNATNLKLTCGPLNCKQKNDVLIIQPIIKDFLEKELLDCVAFNNLKTLYIGELDVNTDFIVVPQFFHLSPNLEVFTLCHEENPQLIRAEKKESKELCFPIRSSRPKMVRIKCHMPPDIIEELSSTFKAKLDTLEII
ncbi:F-box/FBD/LRR protein [Rhynchospora pubera]|uniref:F-box/FBD/LRR protein n=1 Tax=Rhynchospora pubera TaxID=906938 RepID=A0AAV8FH91_9POAL|nr:F-box/FBD/LRR protein [Rhynchospora pubera]